MQFDLSKVRNLVDVIEMAGVMLVFRDAQALDDLRDHTETLEITYPVIEALRSMLDDMRAAAEDLAKAGL